MSPRRRANCSLRLRRSNGSEKRLGVFKRRLGVRLELFPDRQFCDRCVDEIWIQPVDGEQGLADVVLVGL